jgi:hypothetical protein
MAFHLFLFLLVVCLILSLALLWRLGWLPLQPSNSQAGSGHTRCIVFSGPAPRLIVPSVTSPRQECDLLLRKSRPWSEVKSRRGASKRVNTEGFACPNQQCPYFGITDAHIPRRRWQAWPCRADPDLSLSGLPHDVHCPTPHPSLPSENPFPTGRHGADLALAEGLDASAAEWIFGYRQATITTWLTRAGKYAELFHERSFRHLWLPHLQLDELRTRLRSATQVLWL